MFYSKILLRYLLFRETQKTLLDWFKLSVELNYVSGRNAGGPWFESRSSLTKILFSLFENVFILNKTENQFSPTASLEIVLGFQKKCSLLSSFHKESDSSLCRKWHFYLLGFLSSRSRTDLIFSLVEYENIFKKWKQNLG